MAASKALDDASPIRSPEPASVNDSLIQGDLWPPVPFLSLMTGALASVRRQTRQANFELPPTMICADEDLCK